ncbi:MULTISPECIES: hypothetical protein [Reichenbachiella]|uniref:His Kinase A (Phospho-acceptor) domain-containing protein n=1 Tax=Reichenbachiella agariperforans TaxID=156994 RepID=A0A1M6JEM5_REIAG|nr:MULTISPECIES: hypothetical protein [Reichenbachiella]RJE74833.1 hypothetical protein BGP76_17045 [Reichenbachiella sp. MSK19-1]SHJ45131.1 hypothetical protein SAMN04488028_101163 [Reichenbachiella agariperforans]
MKHHENSPIKNLFTTGTPIKTLFNLIHPIHKSFPRQQIEFNISHFLRRPIANMYSMVFEIGINLDKKNDLQRDLNILKSLNKELSKSIQKIEELLKNDEIENLKEDEKYLKSISLSMLM